MHIIQIECPNCGASIGDMNAKNTIQIKCPYCNSTFYTGEVKANRKVDEAEILKIKERRNNNIFVIIVILFIVCSFLAIGISEKIGIKRRDIAISEGKLIPGSKSDYYEINYKVAIKKLKLIGFKNIKHIDLHKGVLFVNDGEVEDITIDGNSHFNQYDGFDPDAQIIITHK